ncbi:GNAT family N-acetyltransferase [Bacillus suaedaesalsae]|uniref:GNAT family N-acetyltransferase n=1 Tax=Bacillus suaedaesalsae TaxID=2810349 RepID=A0ABS2DPF5_9BACI|nr:GNAT family N-acetyltransferase [Bacillus suaedaesalsae]MBM6619556.1 GNAT family N-acetyltransferase [Bacillus suaedaesalsae]
MSNTITLEYPSLQTNRLDLHILTLEHSQEVLHHFSDQDVTRFMDIEPCKDMKEAEEIITYHLNDSGCRWGIFNRETNEMMGTLGFHYLRKDTDRFVAEVGFDLSRKYWGKGYMTEAMNEVLRFGFREIQLDSIDATVEPGNVMSIKLMERLEFNRDIELRDHLIYYYLERKDFGE